MWPMLTQLREKFMSSNRQRRIRPVPWHERPRLEALEDRLLLTLWTFVGQGGGGDGTTWNQALNWSDPRNNPGIPQPGDDAVIPTGFNVVLSGAGSTVNSVGLGGGSTLTVNSYLEANGIGTNPGSTFTVTGGSTPAEVKIDKSASFGGFVNDAGLIDANSSDVNGTSVVFDGGGATIGPGNLNGNLDAGPNSSFTFDYNSNNTLLAPYTIAAGGTLGLGSGSIVIAAPVSIQGTLDDNHLNMNLVPGGYIYGSGSINERANFNATGGYLGVAGGVTVYGGFTSSGGGFALNTTLTNETEFTDLGGSVITIGNSGSIVNLSGIVKLSSPNVIDTGGSTNGITNDPLGFLNIELPGTPVYVYAPFTNLGTLTVDTASVLHLAGPYLGVTSTWTDELSNSVGVAGTLYLDTTATGEGLTESGGGIFYIDDTLISVSAGIVIQGNMEVTSMGLLTGGSVYNSGRLQIDPGGSSSTVTSGGNPLKHGTMGLGVYVQWSSGTLTIELTTAGTYTPLTAGTAQLSGILQLGNYVPVVGDSFTVVVAGAITKQFLYVPDGMDQTVTATTDNVSQVKEPGS